MTWQQEERVLSADLEPMAKFLMFVMGHRADYQTGECWPSQTMLAKDCGLSRKRVNELMNKLVEKELVAQVGWHNRAILYKIFPTSDIAEQAAQRRKERQLKAHAAAKKAQETRARKSSEKAGTCTAGVTSTCTAGVTSTCTAGGTQTIEENKEKNIEFNTSVDSHKQTEAEDRSVCVNQAAFDSIDLDSFDWNEIQKAATRRLVAEGFQEAEAATRVKAELDEAKWYAKIHARDGWVNSDGEKIRHPQKHTAGILANLARKTRRLPPITRNELDAAVETNPQVSELLFCGEEVDDFWKFLVLSNFRTKKGDTISRFTFEKTLGCWAEYREERERRRYGV